MLWLDETFDNVRERFHAALEAARTGDAAACLRAARAAAAEYLRVYLAAAKCEQEATGDDLVSLLDAAVAQDARFQRLRPEAELLATPDPDARELGCDAIVEALKEIRMLADFATQGALGRSRPRIAEFDPCLEEFAVHSTTTDRACSMFAEGALYSYNHCRQRGLLNAPALGAELLGDPRRWLDYVTFSGPQFLSGEIVANSQRKGTIDSELKEDYQPSVRLFFRRAALAALPRDVDDGLHALKIRDQVSLDHLAYAVFPTAEALEAALAAVADPGRAQTLRARCLVAPAGSFDAPVAYVSATNALVAQRVREDTRAGGGQR